MQEEIILEEVKTQTKAIVTLIEIEEITTTTQEEGAKAKMEEENQLRSLMSHVRFSSRLATRLMSIGTDMKKILCQKKNQQLQRSASVAGNEEALEQGLYLDNGAINHVTNDLSNLNIKVTLFFSLEMDTN